MEIFGPFILFAPILFIGGFIVISMYFEAKRVRERQAILRAFADLHNFTFRAGKTTFYPSGSFPDGVVADTLSGTLPLSGNAFQQYYQTEIRGSGKHRRVYKRTIVSVATPDILSQFIINSKLNNHEQSGGNLEMYSGSQKLQLEGNFSEFFDVLVPAGDQQALLMLLAPDVMENIMHNFADYDIEVLDETLYLYAYTHLDANVLIAQLEKIDELIRKMRLRMQDARSAAKNLSTTTIARETVARIATDTGLRKSLVRNNRLWIILVVFLLFLVVPLASHMFLPDATFFIAADIASIFQTGILGFVIAYFIFRSIRAWRIKNRYHEAMRGLGKDKTR